MVSGSVPGAGEETQELRGERKRAGDLAPEPEASALGLGPWRWTSQSLSLGKRGGESWRGEGHQERAVVFSVGAQGR